MTLEDLFLILLFGLLAYTIWQHVEMSRVAKMAAHRHCHGVGVQFLDQSVILKAMTISRSTRSLFAFKRRYSFEFASVGDRRYQGMVILVGNRVMDIELEPFKTIDQF